MKKILVLLVVLLTLCFFASCKELRIETTKISTSSTTDITVLQPMEVTRDTNITTYPPATVPTITTEAETQTTPIEYEDTFESFMLYADPTYHGIPRKWVYFGEKGIYSPDGRWSGTPQLIIYRVVGEGGYVNYIGNQKPHMDYTIYYLQIEYVYGFDEYDTERIYEMHYPGHLDRQVFALPPLEVGTLMAAMTIYDSPESLEQHKFCHAKYITAQKIDDTYYLYGMWTDFSDMECKIAITDPEENSIYKVGKHDKAIAYLESIGQPLPMFDYKCEAEAFYAESIWRSRNNPLKPLS